MPPLPNVPQVCKIEVGGTYHDTEWFNIWYVNYSGSAPSSSDLLNYLGDLESVVEGAYSPEMSVDNEITSIKGTDLTTDTGAVASHTLSTFGVRTGDFVPANVCMVASMEILRRYRGGHPRKYLPWGTAGTYATGSTKDWDSGFVTDCQAKLDGLLTGFGAITHGGTTWNSAVNVSYYTGGAVRGVAQVDVIQGGIIRPRICSQRRRLGKVGG